MEAGMSAKELRDYADDTFSKRTPLLTLWQEIAENFHPLRADFTIKRYLGDDFAGNMMTSFPMLCHRDLQDAIGTMLRNSNKPWFEMAAADGRREDHDAKAWLEWASGVQRRAMYDPHSLMTEATKLADGDFAAFGQAPMQLRLNRNADTLIYRCWHLRDVVWLEDEDSKLCAVFRRWKPSVRTLCRLFDRGPGAATSIHPKVRDRLKKEPFAEVECYHMMVKADLYDGQANSRARPEFEWRSVYYDCDNQHAMEEVAQRNKEYVIPRWVKHGSTQWAYSPAAIIALPEARLLQAMTYTLLEAGEKVVNPPMVATEQVIKSDVSLYAGGITWVDMEYDEKRGEALRALTQDSRGMPLSQEMQKDSRALLSQCFYLNKIKPFLPTSDREMTAYQASQIVAQYIREALPLFEPMEASYNGELCEETFQVLMQHGAFGSPLDMPPSLRGADVQFRFASPLHDAIEQQKGQKFLEVAQLLSQAVSIDKNNYAVVDAVTAFRDALSGICPTSWTRSPQAVKDLIDQQAQQQKQQQLLATLGQGAEVADTLASAQKQMAEAA